ncbi:hypothetical protein JKF63_06040 [Porcisia hertigi]|uniref:Uncharacterized protein n=1 Tax=Porcisia hertigi TaxID=2761500 RepID=A0A836LIU1_9TRYP|nr:hypothetical protein JKF63_06040 [Porcisia hertigi]
MSAHSRYFVDRVPAWRLLLSALLLALILALVVVPGARVFESSHCHSSTGPFGLRQVPAMGHIESLSQRRTRTQSDPNAKLQKDINAYLAAHNRTDDVNHPPIRIHFITVTNRTGWSSCMVAASLALAGVKLRFLGVDVPYSHVWRFERYLDYIDQEGLRDEDIVVTLDTDVSWIGSDLLPFLQRFALYSPPTEAALDLAAVRAWEDYGEDLGPQFMETLPNSSQKRRRPRLQYSPIIFNADDDCYYHQPVGRFFHCFTGDYVMQHLIAAARNGATFFSSSLAARASRYRWKTYKEIYNTSFLEGIGDRLLKAPLQAVSSLRAPSDKFFYDGAISEGRNPSHYLNAGVHISRVWALREMAAAVLRFAREQQPLTGGDWFCDQSIIGILRHYSRIFEINQNLLFEDGHQKDGRLVRDKFGLPVGLISVDRNTEFTFTSHLQRRLGLGKLASLSTFPHIAMNMRVVDSDLVASSSGALVTRSLWSREVSPRCIDVPFLNGSVSRRCSSSPQRDVYPSLLHFAAGSKRKLYQKYRQWFAWYFAAKHNTKALSAAMGVLEMTKIELWHTDIVQTLRFFDVCPSPFHSA